MDYRIHIFGASGAGTTTLAKALSCELGYKFYDTDEFFWVKTDPPFTLKRIQDERLKMMRSVLEDEKGWVLSGSLCGWGDSLVTLFDLAIFLYIPHEIRMTRLEKRERLRYGNSIDAGGIMHENYLTFMDWARQYDQGDISIRSKKMHEAWMKNLQCRLIRIEEDSSIEDKVKQIVKSLS